MKPLRYLALAGLISAVVILGLRNDLLGRRLAELEAQPPLTAKKAERLWKPRAGSSENEEAEADLRTSAELADQLFKAHRELADARKEVNRLRAENERRPGGFLAPRPPLPTAGSGKQVIARWTGGPKRSWGHEQAAGAPDTGQAGDIPSAWASKEPDGGEE